MASGKPRITKALTQAKNAAYPANASAALVRIAGRQTCLTRKAGSRSGLNSSFPPTKISKSCSKYQYSSSVQQFPIVLCV